MQLNSKIYVAGHQGLIGSAFVRALKKEGYTNLLLKNRKELDLTDALSVAVFFENEKPEYVVLAAGKVGGIVDNKTFPADFICANIAIQTNVIQAAHNSNVIKLIFFGSSCMYPRECQGAMSEELLFTGLPEPTSMAYAVSKMAGLQMCLAYNQQYGHQKFVPVIPNSVFGPHDNFKLESAHVLSSLIRRLDDAKTNECDAVTLWGTGSPCREFIYADDVASAGLLLMRSDLQALRLPLNLGSSTDIPIKILSEKIAEIVGYSGNIHWDASKPDGALKKLLDSSRMHQFGWRPQVSFEEGLRATYTWYLENISSIPR